MSFQLEFPVRAAYDSRATGITIETILRTGTLEISCQAKIDTGAEACLFGRTYADFLELELERGYREVFSTLAGNVAAYAHEVELETLGVRFQSYVFFAESYQVQRNLLGRQGWLQLVTLGIDDYHSELYLKPNV
jgi:hypothetical protein